MENNGYGQLRQDIGELKGMAHAVEEAVREHSTEDERRFKELSSRLTIVEKLSWFATGGVSVIGLQTISEIIKNFLIK